MCRLHSHKLAWRWNRILQLRRANYALTAMRWLSFCTSSPQNNPLAYEAETMPGSSRCVECINGGHDRTVQWICPRRRIKQTECIIRAANQYRNMPTLNLTVYVFIFSVLTPTNVFGGRFWSRFSITLHAQIIRWFELVVLVGHRSTNHLSVKEGHDASWISGRTFTFP